MMGAVEWMRPLAAWSLVLPVVVLALSMRRDRFRPVPLGTFALWKGLAVDAGDVHRRRVTPARWFWIAALASACLALTEPRLGSDHSRAILTVVVDRKAPMYLEHTSAQGVGTGSGTRLDRALVELESLLGQPACDGFDPARIRWCSRSPGEEPQIGIFPAAWRTPAITIAPQGWSRFDRSGVLWLTDSLEEVPRRAGWVISGGGPAFGPAAQVGVRRFSWDGRGLTEDDAPVERLTVHVDASLPPTIRAIAEEWARARDHRLVSEDAEGGDRFSLRVRAVAAGPAAIGPGVEHTRAGRDGWSIDGPAAPTPAFGEGIGLQTWLEAEVGMARIPVVGFGPGLVYVGLGDAEPRGDPAAFAVSWSRLLDRACRPAPGVIPVALRRAAGEPDLRAPSLPDDNEARRDEARRSLTAWLAGASVLLGCMALLLRGAGLR